MVRCHLRYPNKLSNIPIHIYIVVRCAVHVSTVFKVTLYSVEVNWRGTLRNGGLSDSLHRGQERTALYRALGSLWLAHKQRFFDLGKI